MTIKPPVKVVTSAERERQAEADRGDAPEGDPTEEKVQDSATIFGKWIKEWRQEKRKGSQKRAPAS